ncbi:hypothetical protein QCA50_005579 [Cerrena zonata]|uniref:PH domain-containing protein n=1 Tax=Cerrena zonata TaxID=2478898 RepID=A0AAW0GLL5_9APHY
MDTKPHRQIPLSQILDALEYDLPTHRHTPSSLVSSPPTSSPQVQNTTIGDKPEGGRAQTHTFKVITPKKTLLLCAPSEEEEIKWLSAVRALIARRSGAGVVPGDGSTTSTVTVTPSAIGGSSSLPVSTSKSAPPLGTLGNETSVSGTVASPVASGSTSIMGRRRDSIVRRLSLSGGGFAGSSGPSSASASAPPATLSQQQVQVQEATASER